MAIYDPIMRGEVRIVGRYPHQRHCFRLGRRQSAAKNAVFRFAKVRYVNGQLTGRDRDIDINYLVADEGSVEIGKAYDAAPLVSDDPASKKALTESRGKEVPMK